MNLFGISFVGVSSLMPSVMAARTACATAQEILSQVAAEERGGLPVAIQGKAVDFLQHLVARGFSFPNPMATLESLHLPPTFVMPAVLMGGGLMCAKVFSRPSSQLLVTATGTLWSLLGGIHDNVAAALGVYLSGVATLRIIKHADFQPLQSFQRLRELPRDLEVDSLKDLLDELPTLKNLYGRSPCYTEAVDHLEKLLCRYPEIRRFFDFKPERRKLLEEIGWVQIADRALEMKKLRLGNGAGIFIPFESILYAGDIVNVAVHELVHVLHFSTVRRRLTFPDLQRILKYFSNEKNEPVIAPNLELVQNFMRGKERSPRYIPEDVRHAAAILAFAIGATENEWHTESVSTFLQFHLDRSVRPPKEIRFSLAIVKLFLWMLAPMAWWGGGLKTTAGFKSVFAYDNPRILRKTLKLGPIDALLGPKSKMKTNR